MTTRVSKLARRALRKARVRAADLSATLSERLTPQTEMAPREDLHAYWQQPVPAKHPPAQFLAQAARSRGLLALLERTVPKDWKILEVGCGVGRNLAFLYDHGYRNLEGIEINPHAVATLRQTYPQLADITIHEGSAEDVLPTLGDDQYNLAFTMSVLQHVHPDSTDVFDHLARVAGQLYVIEGPGRRTRYQYPHNYDDIFTSRGMTKLSSHLMGDFPGVERTFARYVARRYRRMDKQATLHEFWRQPAPPGNNPKDYIRATGRSRALLELISDLPKDARILEVGCNVGRNLAHLYNNGYTKVEGIEINPHAVELLRTTFPQLAESEIHVGAAGEVLPKFADDEFDLVYTMAVLEHIHPDESVVFSEMARIGKQVLAIEPEGRLSHRQFPHDIPKIFGGLGLTIVSNIPMSTFPSNAKDRAIQAYHAYRFHRPDGWTHDQARKSQS